jgi:DNA-binding transcriptional LysR family regulator
MRVTFAQLEAFVCVARFGTVHEASRHLHLAQPTISLRLRDLERAVGTTLFDRNGRGLQLSQDGSAMLDHANRIMSEMGKLKGWAGSGQVSGLVRLGVSETFAFVGLAALLRLVAINYPDLRVELGIGPSPQLIEDIHQHRLDLAIVINPVEDPRLRIMPLGIQPSTWAAAPALGLPQNVRPVDLLHQTVLINPSPSPNHRQTMAWFGAAGLEPMQVSICNTVPSVIAHLVEAGVGIGILPTKLIERQIANGSLVALNARPAIEKAHLCAVCHAVDRETTVDAMLEATRQILREFDMLEPI